MLAFPAQRINRKRGTDFQKCDRTRNGCEKNQRKKQNCEKSSPRNIRKYHRQCTENQSRSLSRLQTKGKYCRKDRNTRENRNHSIQTADDHTAFWNIFLSTQIASVGNRDTHAETQRIKHLSQCRADGGKRERRKIRLEDK